ncbi:MAG TPA: hypothetical protein VGM20_11160 [Gemmatimonadales bacterium]
MTDPTDSRRKPRPPEFTELKDGKPLPKELTGRASETTDGLPELFADDDAEHFADGFHGGSNGDPDSDVDDEEPKVPDNDGDVTAD